MVINKYQRTIVVGDYSGIEYLFQIGDSEDYIWGEILLKCFPEFCIMDFRLHDASNNKLKNLRNLMDLIIKQTVMGIYNYPGVVLFTKRESLVRMFARQKGYKILDADIDMPLFGAKVLALDLRNGRWDR